MNELLLHPQVRQSLQKLTDQPTHAVLLAGPQGAGKHTLALLLIRQLLRLRADKPLESYPYYFYAAPVNGTHSIATIRSLHEFLRLRTTGEGAIRRSVLIEDAQGLTIEAQNAFLKLLEEPPADTVIVLTCVGERSLLPTIYSRVQKVRVQSPGKQVCLDYFGSQGFPPATVERAYYMSDGQAGLMHALLHEDSSHPLAQVITEAKGLLTMTMFERLTQVERLSKQKEALPSLLFALERICHAALSQASNKDKTADIKKWHAALKRVVAARQSLPSNPQSKLLLTDLFMAL